MAKKSTEDRKSSNKEGSEERNYSNNSGKKSYQPTTDRTTKPPKKDGK